MIEGGMRKKLVAGMRLVASYKKVEHAAEVVEGEEGKLRFRLADGREFKSPSAAASAVMGGIAANGWRWWSLDGAEPPAKPATRTVKPNTAPTPQAARTGAQDTATAKVRPRCPRCGKQFVGPSQRAHHEANADRLCNPA